MVVLAHLSDLHFDGGARAAARVARVLAFLDTVSPAIDAVLVTGDIVHHGRVSEYEEARAALSSRSRLLVCPGNHDTRTAFRQVLLQGETGEGPINVLHEVHGLLIAMCDSTVPGRESGYLDDKTFTWLARVLETAGDRVPVLVAFHHPPVTLQSPYVDGIRQDGELRLAELLNAYPQVKAVLCGHAHTAAASTFAGRPLLIAPGVASTLPLAFECDVIDESLPPGLALHVLDDDGRLTTHYRFLPMMHDYDGATS